MQVRSIGLIALSVLACLVVAPVAVAAPGALDPTFDGDGRVTTDLGSASEEGDAVAIQPDGKIVVLAQTEDEDTFVTTSVLIRYDSSGALDPTFDSDGILVVSGMDPADVAVQSDGKIVVVGGVLIDLGDSVTADFAVARFNTDGTPDTTFSDDGRATADFDGRWDGATAVALQADGKIVAAGGTGGNLSHTSQDFAVARFNTDGTPDTSFGGDGTTNTNVLGTSEQAFAVVVQTNGKVVVGGKAHQKKTGQDFALVRYRSNGALDLGFSGDGKLRTSFDVHDTLSGLALQSDGKIVAAGTAGGPTGEDFALARYTLRGRLDTTFSKDGKQHTDFSKGNDEAEAVSSRETDASCSRGSARV